MKLPDGFLGTRADVLMDVAIIVFTALPFVLIFGIRYARHRHFMKHRRFQTAAALLVLLLLVLFELDIRLCGGSQAFISKSSFSAGFVRTFLICHVAIALLTGASWLALIVRSRARFLGSLPGTFSARHRWWGWLTFVGVCLLSSSGFALYMLLFAV